MHWYLAVFTLSALCSKLKFYLFIFGWQSQTSVSDLFVFFFTTFSVSHHKKYYYFILSSIFKKTHCSI